MQISPRLRFALAALACIPLGLASKRPQIVPIEGLSDTLGGAFYVLFGTLSFWAIFPRTARSARFRVVAAILLLTCAIEFLQLWHPPFLETLRETLLGRHALGTTFSIGDFPGYAIGAMIAIVVGGFLAADRQSETKRQSEEKHQSTE